MKKFIEKIVSWLYGVKPGLLYSFIIGLIVAMFFLVVAKMYVCFWPALMLALILAFAKMWVKETSSYDWPSVLAALAGAIVVQLLVWLAIRSGVPVVFS